MWASVAVEMRLRVELKLRQKTKQGNGDEAEEPPSLDTQETCHETDSEFVPNAAEIHRTKNNSSCTSDSVTLSDTENSGAHALAEYCSEEEATSKLENLIANQV